MKSPQKNNPFKYYFKGTQIAFSVFAAVFIGYQIDKKLNHEIYIATIIFSSLVIVYTLWALIKDVNKEK